MSTDPIEKAIGRFGRYQSWILVIITIGRLPTDFQLTNVVFLLPSVDYICLDETAGNATNFCPCQNPLYDTSTIVTSVTSNWNLICDRTSLASLAQSMLQIGVLIGSIVYGFISDRYGRKIACLLCLSLTVLAVTISALVPEFWMFLACRFLIGTGVGGTMLCCYILQIEICGKSFRSYFCGLHEISYILGYMCLPIIAFYVRDWRMLQLVTSVPWVFVVGYYWLLPESPRWLITVGKKEESIRVMSRIARRNKLPTDQIQQIVNEIEEEAISEAKQRGSYADLFKTPKIRVRTFIVALVWAFCTFLFFGLNQYIGRLDGNLYLNVILSAAFLAPGLLLCVIATIFLKRKTSVVITFSIAALSLIALIFVPDNFNATVVAFAIIGQVGAYTSFVLVYLFTSEVFPTVVRNSAMGFASMFARFGGFLAPFVVNIGIQWVSISIFSLLAFCAAALCCFLPETKDIVLLNTIGQAEDVTYESDIKEIHSHSQSSVK